MNNIEDQIKKLTLDEPSKQLDSAIEQRLNAAYVNNAPPLTSPDNTKLHRGIMFSGLSVAALLLIGLTLFVINWANPVQLQSEETVTTIPGVKTNDGQLVVREQFLIEKHALLVCWSSSSEDGSLLNLVKNSRNQGRLETVSHTGNVKYRLIPLRTDFTKDGVPWHWALFVADDPNVDARRDPPFIKDEISGIAMMLTGGETTSEVATTDQLITAQQKTMTNHDTGPDGRVFELTDLQMLVHER